MNAKRLLALLLAMLMLVALFTACSNDTADDDSGKKDDAATDDGGKKDDAADDAPAEGDYEIISWMPYSSDENYNKAVEGEYENLRQAVEVQHKYGFEIEAHFVDAEVYTSTATSLMASDSLPQVFCTYGIIDDNTVVGWIEAGIFLPLSEVIEYSTGNMIKAFGEEGIYDWARAKATYTDGDWYYVLSTNNPARSFRITEEDGPLRVSLQNHGVYGLVVRQDWLDTLGLEMPQNTEEYYEAVYKMNKEDVNGNGQNEERIILGLGTEYQYQGIGQWFGLPYLDFFSDPSSGEVEVAMLKKGFGDWATYMNRFYAEGLIYNNEGGHPWYDSSAQIAANEAISLYRQVSNLWSTGRSNCSDPNCNYQPMPIIAAVEGEKARIICQEATAGEYGLSFQKSKIGAESAAKFVDCMYSYELFLLFYYGVEGKTWEYAEDGVNIIDYAQAPDYVRDDMPNGYRAFEDMDDFFMGFVSYMPTPRMADMWSPIGANYASPAEALAAGEPYAEMPSTREDWMAQEGVDYDTPNWVTLNALAEWGEENINVAAYYDYETLPTAEEAQIQGELAVDLKTYLQENATKLVLGELDVSEIQSLLDYAYESLGLQEYIDIQQARVDRFMDAMGL